MKNILILLSLLILASCSGSGKNIALLSQELKSDETKIFVKRDTGWVGAGALIKVQLDGKVIGELGEDERLSASKIFNGASILTAGFTMIASVGSKDASRAFEIKKGEKLFFIIKQDQELFGTKLKIYPIDRMDFFAD